ncbi:MAG TPA: hypothetical protein VJ862_04285, partial [Rhodanobacteraceae bacterium]|nr:hypothetical protein [Rhodanobacteraceae bacterium]
LPRLRRFPAFLALRDHTVAQPVLQTLAGTSGFDRDGAGAMKVESILMRSMFAMAALAVVCGIVVISLH